MSKITEVTLCCGEEKVQFELGVAEKLLNYEAQLGLSNWALKDDKFNFENGIIKGTNSGTDKKSKKQELDSEGDIPSE